jgi:hypothetical protein
MYLTVCTLYSTLRLYFNDVLPNHLYCTECCGEPKFGVLIAAVVSVYNGTTAFTSVLEHGEV